MLENFMDLTERQKQLVAYSKLLDCLLDEGSKERIRLEGIVYVAQAIGSRYKVTSTKIEFA